MTDMEISAINFSTNDQTNAPTEDIQKAKAAENEKSAFAWHYDSYPFVCVTMLSDCTGMVGGETALKTASREVMKVRGPAMVSCQSPSRPDQTAKFLQGTAVIMQGRYPNHAALKAFGGRERISQITSLRSRSPLAKDETVLTGVRSISNVSDLYTQWTRYRLENLQYRVHEKLKSEQIRKSFDREFNLEEMRSWFTENIAYMQATLEELQEVS